MPNHQKNETRWSHVLEVRPCHNTPSRFTRALADIGAGEIGVTQLEEDLWTTKADSRSCTSGEATQHQRLCPGRLEVNRLTQISQAPSL